MGKPDKETGYIEGVVGIGNYIDFYAFARCFSLYRYYKLPYASGDEGEGDRNLCNLYF